MLYVTTRNKNDVYTAHRALMENRGPDGGMFMPFHDPVFSRDEILSLKGKTFGQCVAEQLNRQFRTRLTSWDVELTVGRYAVRLERLGRKAVICESWHNLESDFGRLVRSLTKLLRQDTDLVLPSDWTCIAVRIAVLFGVFGELMRQGLADIDRPVDVTAPAGDFSAVMSVWYARKWGLPVGNILCACNENGNLWDLFCHGVLRTGEIAKDTGMCYSDYAYPEGLERLICSVLGLEETLRFLDVARRGGNYYLDDLALKKLRRGMYATVSSCSRISDTIRAAYATHRYVLSPYSALALAGLQDYRARTGGNTVALLLAERSPLLDGETVSDALGISVEDLKQYFL